MTNVVISLLISIIGLLEFLFFARAIFSWLPQSGGSKVSEFLYLATEPLIVPFRKLLDRVDFLRGFPLDIPFLLAFITLGLLTRLLYIL